MDKNTLRKEYIKIRNSIDTNDRIDKSKDILRNLIKTGLLDEYNDVLCYVNYKSEVSTDILLDYLLEAGKSLFCPKVIDTDMNFYRITDRSDLQEGYQGIYEPIESLNNLYRNNKPLVIVPGSVFDKRGNRIGYGKGFYDRFFFRFPNSLKIGLAFEEQIIESIDYIDEFDIKMDYIVTDRKVYVINE